MTNVERIARLLRKDNSENVLIHTIPETQMWIVAQREDSGNWQLTLMHPDKDTSYSLGTINNENHIEIWQILVGRAIENRSKGRKINQKAQELRALVKKLTSVESSTNYGKFTYILESNKVSRRAKDCNKKRSQ